MIIRRLLHYTLSKISFPTVIIKKKWLRNAQSVYKIALTAKPTASNWAVTGTSSGFPEYTDIRA